MLFFTVGMYLLDTMWGNGRCLLIDGSNEASIGKNKLNKSLFISKGSCNIYCLSETCQTNRCAIAMAATANLPCHYAH